MIGLGAFGQCSSRWPLTSDLIAEWLLPFAPMATGQRDPYARVIACRVHALFCLQDTGD
jgi:hypothetical protein